MGLTYADIIVLNSADEVAFKKGFITEEDVKKVNVQAMVDSGAITLIINDAIAEQLDLEVLDNVDVELADGTHSKRKLVGPVTIHFKNRKAHCSALVIPGATEVLLGVIPLEAMDVIIDPLSQQLDVHPDRPYFAGMKVK